MTNYWAYLYRLPDVHRIITAGYISLKFSVSVASVIHTSNQNSHITFTLVITTHTSVLFTFSLVCFVTAKVHFTTINEDYEQENTAMLLQGCWHVNQCNFSTLLFKNYLHYSQEAVIY